MQRKHLIWSGSVVGIAILAACQSDVLTASAESEASAAPSSAHSDVGERVAPRVRAKSAAGAETRVAVNAERVVDVGFDVGQGDLVIDAQTGFAVAAFPPTIPDRAWHADAWNTDDCMSCHETGVGEAPMIRHRGLPDLAFESKCRTCHVLIPGKTEMVNRYEAESLYEDYAFPPMLPNNVNHAGSWNTNNCLLCHENGVRGAPKIRHRMLPPITMEAKCRTCHVQVRSIEAPWMDR